MNNEQIPEILYKRLSTGTNDSIKNLFGKLLTYMESISNTDQIAKARKDSVSDMLKNFRNDLDDDFKYESNILADHLLDGKGDRFEIRKVRLYNNDTGTDPYINSND